MKKPVAMTLALLLCSFVFTFSAGAVDAPHYDPLVGNVCGTCHTVQQTLGSTGYNNICQNCHRPGSPAAGSKSITPADAANPFGIYSTTGITRMYQTSHRWDGSDTNPAAGAQPPVQWQMTTNNLRARAGGQLACVRCHNQHSNANGNFLRIANDKDQLCLDCHRSRDVQSQTQGSHPVGINYAAKVAANPALFNARTINANPANPTSNLFARMSSAGGTLLCSTCHSVHFADSRSSTPDGSANFANLSSGDGYILRTERRGTTAGAGFDSSTNICTTCHAGKTSHNLKGQDIQCNDCHGAHVEYDQNDPTGSKGKNIYLIRRAVDKGTTGSGNIFFRYTGSRREYKNGQSTGVCQGCHSVPEGSNYPAEHSASNSTAKDCNVCHYHGSINGSFSGACTACHGYPPLTATLAGPSGLAIPATGATPTSPGAHETHAKKRWMACNTCHTGYAGKSMPSNTIDIGFSINSSNFKSFVAKVNGGVFNGTTLNSGYSWSTSNSTTLTTGNSSITCSVYCHGATLASGTGNKPVWTGTNQAACGSCHKVANNDSGSHTKHLTANPDCGVCHTGASPTSYTAQSHVNGQVDVANGYNPDAASKSCSAASCHANPYGTGSVSTPAWGSVNAACAGCHAFSANGGPATGSHGLHLAVFSTCGDCHAGATAGVSGGTGHANGYVDVTNGYPTNVAKHSAGSGYSSCSAASCHSNPYGSGTAITPVWGTSAGCSACHGAYPISATGPATGSHTTVTGHAVACATCHAAGTTATSAPSTGHANGYIDVANVGYATLNKAKGTAGTTCSTASCHASPVGTSLIVTPAWGSTGNGCAACHSGANAITANGPATGSHTTIAGHAVACTNCHAVGTTATTVPTTGHANGSINVVNVGYVAGTSVAKHASGTGYSTCSAATCHVSPYGTASVTSPAWGSAGNGCAACHTGANAITATGPATGSHTTVASHAVACITCHAAGTTATSVPSTGHATGTINVVNVGYLAGTSVAKHASGTGYSTCSTASCHLNVYGTGPAVTPVWGTTGNGCTACHTAPIGVNGPATGSHAAVAGHAVACITCHAAGTTATSVPSTGHATGTINVVNVGYVAGTSVAKHTSGSGYSTCSTSVCHGSLSPAWGASTSNDLCTKCHGTGTAGTVTAANREVIAPVGGILTGTGLVSDSIKVGAHMTHLKFLNGFSNYSTVDYRCQTCHGSLPTTGSHANGTSTPVFQGLATKNGAITTASYSAATGCSNVYCHNPAGANGTLNTANAGTGVTPLWTNAAYLGNKTTDAKSTGSCSVCHKVPGDAGFTASFNHGATVIANDCSSCHGHNGDTTGTLGKRHLDGVKFGSGGTTCDGCHDYDTQGIVGNKTWGTVKNANYGGNNEGIGAHAQHIEFLKTRWGVTLDATADFTAGFAAGNALKVCNTCHTKTGHQTGTLVHVTFGDAPTTLTFGTSAQTLMFGSTAPSYNGVPQTSSSSANKKTCSNISCHYFTTPIWSTY